MSGQSVNLIVIEYVNYCWSISSDCIMDLLSDKHEPWYDEILNVPLNNVNIPSESRLWKCTSMKIVIWDKDHPTFLSVAELDYIVCITGTE